MKREFRAGTLVFTIAFIISLLMSFVMPGLTPAASPYDQLASSVLQKNKSLYEAGKLADGGWGNFGSYDAYVLKQAGVDVGTWVYAGSTFKAGIINLVDATIAAESGSKETSLRVARDYLGAKSINENDRAAQLLAILKGRQATGGNGAFDSGDFSSYSNIAAFELLGRAGVIDQVYKDEAISYILGNKESGAWPLPADGGPDFMATAQAVRALKYLDPQVQQANVTAAINSGCDWLKSKQNSDGSFRNSWDDPATDTAEVIATLKLLGIDPASWSNSGKTALDYLQTYVSNNNVSSNTWVLDACLKLGATASINPGGGGDTGSETPNTITVTASVMGKNNESLFGPAQLTLNKNQSYGLTALGALQATGLSWSFSPQFDTMVETIAGQKNEGMCGWMYKINGNIPMIPARDAALAQGDSVIWWYSTNTDSMGNTPGTTGLSSQKGQEIKAVLDRYKIDFGKLGASTLLKSLEQRMAPAELEALQKELDANNVILKDKEVGTAEAIIFDAKQEVVLYIPEKALSETKKLSVQELAPIPRAGQYAYKMVSSLYEFGPNGTKFAKPVTISLKVPITADMDMNKLTPAWYDETKRQWVAIPGIIDLKESRVLFNIDHFTDFALIELPSKSSFKDIGENLGEAWEAIEILAGQGVIKGTGSGFEPQRYITRAEFARLLVEALGLEAADEKVPVYKDVNNSDWYYKAVQIASTHKILTGYPDLTFRPNQSISRYEIATIIYKLNEQGENLAEFKLSYKDQEKIPALFVNGAKYLQRYDLIKADADGNFKGESPVTRAEIALLLFKYLNLP